MTFTSLSEQASDAGTGAPGDQPQRHTTGHLKVVPADRAIRQQIRSTCKGVAVELDKSNPLSKQDLESIARRVLGKLGLPEGYVGWTMVILASEFWRDQVASVPTSRRLLLLPHCLKDFAHCPADYDQYGLRCQACGCCRIDDFGVTAEGMGYRILVAEGSPLVMQVIISGEVDAIIGVACLNVLEKAIDKILLAGIPCMAVPLLSGDCKNTAVDADWVDEMIRVHRPQPGQQTRTYMHLMRAASKMFQPQELERLVPRSRGGPRLAEANGQGLASLDPVAATEAVAYDFLGRGGKYSRPFITLAVFDALTGGRGTMPDGQRHVAAIPDAVKRTALSIETFHKASLVHDDIEDDDQYRYGEETLHRRYGSATAINTGDYMIGLGYRLVSREVKSLGADVVADILDCFADAHTRLSEGQGAELVWRDSRDKRLKPIDALKIYALKTAPAFEAALYAGMRLAGPADQWETPIKQFARNLGVAFQILNDLGDWRSDDHNKRVAGGDTVGGRPTILWALALEALQTEQQQELFSLVGQDGHNQESRLRRVQQLFAQAGVFDKAHLLIDKYQKRAQEVADGIEPAAFRRLLCFLIDTVLQRPLHTNSMPDGRTTSAVETLPSTQH